MLRRARLLIALALAACSSSTTPGDTDSGTTPGTDTGPVARGELPCDVLDVVAARCLTCHTRPPSFGAPMALVDQTDFHADALTVPTERVYQRAMARIHSTTAPMPPITAPALDAAQLATLDAWLGAGAPARAAGITCTPPPPPPPPPDLPCTPTHTFLSHAPGSATAPYQLGAGATNQYICFTFASPFTTSQQATGWGPVIGDERVVHHWILYRTATAQADGGVGPCNMPIDATFIMGWAPGGGAYVMPPDIGLELRQGTANEWLILQVHYNNPTGIADVMDSSGVEICTTDTPRAQTAGVLAFGTTNIAIPPRATGYSTTGTCSSFLTGLLPEPLHILSSGPHMHELGTSFTTEIIPGGTGTPENLVTVSPWSFDSQSAYPHDPPRVINPGDAVRTTCTYSNPGASTVTFGERTEDEMCFNFMMVYPITVIPPGTLRYCSDS
jgi:hypothetical protein